MGVGSVWCSQKIYGLLLIATIIWMFMSLYTFDDMTTPTFFEENIKCLEGKTAGMDAQQLWLSFHTVVNQCSSKNYLVYHHHRNDELDVDNVVINAESWDCTIASYGLSQSSSVELNLSLEAPFCQFYAIGLEGSKRDGFTKIGEYFESKESAVTGRSERKRREATSSNSDRVQLKKKTGLVEKLRKVKAEQNEKGTYVIENPFENDKKPVKDVLSKLIKQEEKEKRKLEHSGLGRYANRQKAKSLPGKKNASKLHTDGKRIHELNTEQSDEGRQMKANRRGTQFSSRKSSEVENADKKSKENEKKVDKRVGYLIKQSAGVKEVEQNLGQTRESVLKKIEENLRTTNKPSKITDDETSTTSEPSTTESSSTNHPLEADDIFTTRQFYVENETLTDLGDEKNMIDDDKDYLMLSTISVDSDSTSRKTMNVDVETFLLKYVKRKMIYQLSVNVANGFEVLTALTKRSLMSIDICQINIILPKPTKKNLIEFASFYKYASKSMGLIPLVVDLIGEDMRIFFINTSSPLCLNVYVFSGGRPVG